MLTYDGYLVLAMRKINVSKVQNAHIACSAKTRP